LQKLKVIWQGWINNFRLGSIYTKLKILDERLRNRLLKKVGDTNLTDGQLKELLIKRKKTIAKFLDKGDSWHCSFITYASLQGKDGWNQGQPHFHYISDKFNIPRETVINRLKSRKYNLGSLPHIKLNGYKINT